MAWRPTEYLLEGELDNTTPGIHRNTSGVMILNLPGADADINGEGNRYREMPDHRGFIPAGHAGMHRRAPAGTDSL